MGNLLFIDLRDRQGVSQVVFSTADPALLEEAKKARPEFVVSIRGTVRKRDPKSVNPHMGTGEVEVAGTAFRLLNMSKVPPFVVADDVQASEELRFKHRYLDLRRPKMQGNLKLRHEAALLVRNFMSANGFFEIETPVLGKSTPEGARDYLVPSRIYKGRFYALPQSPQLYKQMLMIAGFDRYFQIVRCFRDEDLRSERQPEFTQIDVEMSFIDREDVYALVEKLMAALFAHIGEKIETPFIRLTYKESMERYGTDKPDLRAGLEIRDLSEAARGAGSEILDKALAAGCAVKALVVDGAGSFSRSRLDKLVDRAKALGAPGLFWMKKAGGMKASFKADEAGLESLWKASGAAEADLLLMVADKEIKALKTLGEIRHDFVLERAAGRRDFKFAWVTDFPLFEWSEEEGRYVSVHHPFTAPNEEDLEFLESDPARVRAKAYDIVLNGYEIGGGSIRIHDQDLQARIFKAIGLGRGGGPGQVRILPGCPELRDAAPRRHRLRVRQAGHAPRGRGVHPRGHPLPQDHERPVPPHGIAVDRRRAPARRAGHRPQEILIYLTSQTAAFRTSFDVFSWTKKTTLSMFRAILWWRSGNLYEASFS